MALTSFSYNPSAALGSKIVNFAKICSIGLKPEQQGNIYKGTLFEVVHERNHCRWSDIVK